AGGVGVRGGVACGPCMLAGGLPLWWRGWMWPLFVGTPVGALFASGGVYPPLLVYVSRWFDRRRGTAIALISSGQYIAGVVWPSVFERGIAGFGWQTVMLAWAAVVLVVLLPTTLLLQPAPVPPLPPRAAGAAAKGRARVAGLRPNVAQALLCLAGFCCCVPMSVPQAHLVAFCSDIGISPARSAVMLSVMLAAAFLARQAWGAVADPGAGLGPPP